MAFGRKKGSALLLAKDGKKSTIHVPDPKGSFRGKPPPAFLRKAGFEVFFSSAH